MQNELKLKHNVYFALVSMVIITFSKNVAFGFRNETLYVNAIQFIFMDRKYNSSYRNDTYFYRYSI